MKFCRRRRRSRDRGLRRARSDRSVWTVHLMSASQEIVAVALSVSCMLMVSTAPLHVRLLPGAPGRRSSSRNWRRDRWSRGSVRCAAVGGVTSALMLAADIAVLAGLLPGAAQPVHEALGELGIGGVGAAPREAVIGERAGQGMQQPGAGWCRRRSARHGRRGARASEREQGEACGAWRIGCRDMQRAYDAIPDRSRSNRRSISAR